MGDQDSVSLAQALGLVPSEAASYQDGTTDTQTTPPAGEAAPPAAPTTPNWDDDANPYKQEAIRARQQGQQGNEVQSFLTQQTQQIEAEGRLALAQLMSGPVAQGQMTAEAADLVVRSLTAAARANIQSQADRMALAPTASRQVAEMIAKEYSVGGVEITPEELADAANPEAMKAVAATLQKVRRDAASSKRAETKTDVVEGGASMVGVDQKALEGLTGQSMIKLGLLRGQR